MLHKPSTSLDLSSEPVNTLYVPSHPENLDLSNIIDLFGQDMLIKISSNSNVVHIFVHMYA